MDLGATICTPKRPACALCPWTEVCGARAEAIRSAFRARHAKAEGRLRRGAAFVAVRADGELLARTRPRKGLLGGMTEVPTTPWSHDFDETTAIEQAPALARIKRQWRRIPGVVTHVFTHFPLELVVYTPQRCRQARWHPSGMRWIAGAELAGEALPTVMRKVLAHALAPPGPGLVEVQQARAGTLPAV